MVMQQAKWQEKEFQSSRGRKPPWFSWSTTQNQTPKHWVMPVHIEKKLGSLKTVATIVSNHRW